MLGEGGEGRSWGRAQMCICTFKGYDLHWSPEFLCCWQMESAVPVSHVRSWRYPEEVGAELLFLHKRSSLSSFAEGKCKDKKVFKHSADCFVFARADDFTSGSLCMFCPTLFCSVKYMH